MRSELGAIIPLPRRGDGWQDRDAQSGEAFGEFGDLLALPMQLFLVGEVLILAAATSAKEVTAWLDPIW